jgi:hypothetical protein
VWGSERAPTRLVHLSFRQTGENCSLFFVSGYKLLCQLHFCLGSAVRRFSQRNATAASMRTTAIGSIPRQHIVGLFPCCAQRCRATQPRVVPIARSSAPSDSLHGALSLGRRPHYHKKANFTDTLAKLGKALSHEMVVELRSLPTANNGLRFDNRYCLVFAFRGETVVRAQSRHPRKIQSRAPPAACVVVISRAGGFSFWKRLRFL